LAQNELPTIINASHIMDSNHGLAVRAFA